MIIARETGDRSHFRRAFARYHGLNLVSRMFLGLTPPGFTLDACFAGLAGFCAKRGKAE